MAVYELFVNKGYIQEPVLLHIDEIDCSLAFRGDDEANVISPSEEEWKDAISQASRLYTLWNIFSFIADKGGMLYFSGRNALVLSIGSGMRKVKCCRSTSN